VTGRTLSFPPDRSVGRVEYRTGDGWTKLDAQGDVEIPADKRVRIVVTANVRDLRFDDVEANLVASVFLQHRKLGDEVLRTMTHFGGLLELRLDNTSVTDDGISVLDHFPQLGLLNLRGTRITDAGLSVLGGLGALVNLDLGHTRILGDGLAGVAGCQALRSLSLEGTRIDGDALRHIAGLTELRLLNLQGTSFGDEHVRYLERLTQLRTLLLRSTQVTPEGIVRLPKCANLNMNLPTSISLDEAEEIRSVRPDLIVDGRRRRAVAAQPRPGEPQRKPVAVTGAEFDDVVLASDVPVLVDFWADWCQPCKQLDPVIDDVARKSGGVFMVAKVDTEEARGIAERYGIMSIPTLVLFVGGDEVLRFSGPTSADILNEVRTTLGTPAS